MINKHLKFNIVKLDIKVKKFHSLLKSETFKHCVRNKPLRNQSKSYTDTNLGVRGAV